MPWGTGTGNKRDNNTTTDEITAKIAEFSTPGEFFKLLMEEGIGNVMPVFGLDPSIPLHWDAFYFGLTVMSGMTFGIFHTNVVERIPEALPESFEIGI